MLKYDTQWKYVNSKLLSRSEKFVRIKLRLRRRLPLKYVGKFSISLTFVLRTAMSKYFIVSFWVSFTCFEKEFTRNI